MVQLETKQNKKKVQQFFPVLLGTIRQFLDVQSLTNAESDKIRIFGTLYQQSRQILHNFIACIFILRSIHFQVFGSAPSSLPGPPRLLHPASLADVHFPRPPQNLLPKSEDLAKKLSGLQAHFASLGNGSKSPDADRLTGKISMERIKKVCGCLNSTGGGGGGEGGGGRARRGRRGEPPEITYCVVEDGGPLKAVVVAPTIPMPDQEELNSKFSELVVRLAFFLNSY